MSTKREAKRPRLLSSGEAVMSSHSDTVPSPIRYCHLDRLPPEIFAVVCGFLSSREMFDSVLTLNSSFRKAVEMNTTSLRFDENDYTPNTLRQLESILPRFDKSRLEKIVIRGGAFAEKTLRKMPELLPGGGITVSPTLRS